MSTITTLHNETNDENEQSHRAHEQGVGVMAQKRQRSNVILFRIAATAPTQEAIMRSYKLPKT